MSPRGLVRCLPVPVTFLVLYLVLRSVDMGPLEALLQAGEPGTLVVAASLGLLLQLFLSADKWRLVVRSAGYPLSLRAALRINTGTLPLKFLVPLRAGEATKALCLQLEGVAPLEPAVGTVIFDRLMGLAALLVTAAAAAPLLDPSHSWTWIAAGLLVALLLFGRPWEGRFLAWVARVGRSPGAWVERMGSVASRITPGARLVLLGYSLLCLQVDITFFHLLLQAYGADLSLAQVALRYPMVLLACHLPLTLAGVGTREAAAMAIFSGLASPAQLVSAAFAASNLGYLLPTLLSLPLLPGLVRSLAAGERPPR